MTVPAARTSLQFFESGYYCAESVLLALAESQGIQSDLLPRIATGFCSGMARTGGQCGAVSGAVMGLSLASGRKSPTDSTTENYAQVKELIRRFEERFGSTNCQALLGCDLDTPEGQAFYRANRLGEKCRQYVEGAAEISMSVLEKRAP